MRQAPICPCCSKRHWPRHSISIYAPTVLIARTPRYDSEQLIDAIVRVVGDLSFSANELKRHAEKFESPLREAIGGMSCRQLGKALRAIMEKDFDGFRIERQGVDKDGAYWHVVVRR